MNHSTKVFTKAEMIEEGIGKMHKVIYFGNGNRVSIPIHKDGSVKWFDDSRLLKK